MEKAKTTENVSKSNNDMTSLLFKVIKKLYTQNSIKNGITEDITDSKLYNEINNSSTEGTFKEKMDRYLKDNFATNKFLPTYRDEFARTLEKAKPFYLFYSALENSIPTHEDLYSISFQDLLDPSLGELSESLQINTCVDLHWLWAQYYAAGYSNTPMLLLYGKGELKDESKNFPNIETVKVDKTFKYDAEHAKVSLFHYKDGSMRVIVSTSALNEEWNACYQGFWVSPTCPPLKEFADSTSGNGPTNFKNDLLDFLNAFLNNCGIQQLRKWITIIKKTDFSHINVFLITTVAGTHRCDDKYGHLKLASLLSQHLSISEHESKDWKVIAQASSIGFLGNRSANSWFNGELRKSFSRDNNYRPSNTLPNICIVYPTKRSIESSSELSENAHRLSFREEFYRKEPWVKGLLYQWKASQQHRNFNIPNIKTYCRVSPDNSKMAWFMLTSANISRSGWGFVSHKDNVFVNKAYEAGVLFLPKFISKEKTFKVAHNNTNNNIPFPYDLPLKQYESRDEPYLKNGD